MGCTKHSLRPFGRRTFNRCGPFVRDVPFSFEPMTQIHFRLAPLFALVAALFAPLAHAGDAIAEQATMTEPALLAAPLDAAAADTTTEPVTDTVLESATETTPAFAPITPENPLMTSPPATMGADADLWARVRQGFKMGEVDTPAVRAQERFYASHPEYMKRVVDRGRRYLYFIVSEVERRGMPTEIALLPIVESAFVPKAQSHALASGLWQFIPSTGQRYGLERTWWYDGRQDVMAATYAALDYLQDLYNLFGDWQLALAAYNWGEGGVGRALAKTRARGLEDDFDTIKKPRETENYVPKLLAVRNIIANPEAFGVKIPSVPDKPYFQPVSTGRHMDLQLAAQLAGTTVDELLHLNPGLIRPVFAHKEDRKLLLPVDKVENFERNLKSYDKPLLSWQPYVTKRGESLDGIADKFNIQLAELRDVNKLGSARAANGQTILVPIRDNMDVSERQNLAALISGAIKPSDKEDDAAEEAPLPAARAMPAVQTTRVVTRYRVQRGDTLFSIAKRHGMTVTDIKALNDLKSNSVTVGKMLNLDVESGQEPEVRLASSKKQADKSRKARDRQHVVRSGDTLDEIARRYDVSVADLKRWNRPAAKGVLRVGYKLQIRNAS